MQLTIDKGEVLSRREKLLEHVTSKGFEAFVTFGSTSIFYLTGFYFISTERPAALLVKANGETLLFLPQLESEHSELASVDEIRTYSEYPGLVHPMQQFGEIMTEKNLSQGKILAESSGYGSAMGYRGPSLDQVLPHLTVTIDQDLVEKMRMIKSPQEIKLIRESAKWGNLAHVYLQDYCGDGKTENEVSMQASQEATIVMMKTLGPQYKPLGYAGARAGFRGQIGANSALPHAVNINAVMRKGDNLVTGAAAGVGGYTSELERTMFLGQPSEEQKKYFSIMMEMMETAFQAIKPGIPCSEVDKAVNRVYEKYDIWQTWRHHTGHALGILGHEAPFFDIGDNTILEPGMVFSVEPGIYIPGVGGFRHSDTLVVTEKGMDLITYYPSQLQDMIIAL